jgi:hypothetical protein
MSKFKNKLAVVAGSLAATITLILLTGVGTNTAQAGFSASVSSSNIAGSGTSFLTAKKQGGTQCTSVPSGRTIPDKTVFPCSGEVMPTGSYASSSATVALSQNGTVPFTRADFRVDGCAPVNQVNSIDTGDHMMAHGGITFNQNGPTNVPGVNSTTYRSSAYSSNVLSSTGPQTFSAGIWFRTTTAEGALFGWSTSPSANLAGHYDRSVYLTSAGKLAFATYPQSAAQIITSPNSYNDNTWHYVVATAQSGVTASSSKITLNVDGVDVATSTFNSPTAAENSVGYWHIGQSFVSTSDGYTGNGRFFTGQLSNFAVFNNVLLSGTQINNLYNAGHITTFRNRVMSYGATDYWFLGDTGLTTFAGPYPVVGNQDICSHFNVTVGTDTKCLHPSLGTACPALSSDYTYATIGKAPTVALDPSTPSAPQNVITRMARNDAFNPSYDTGLILLMPTTINEYGFNQTFVWASNRTIIF